MKKNVSGQKIGAQLVSATDGSAFTGSVTCYVTGDAGTQGAGSVGSGACTHEGNGYHTYAPAQAETNYDLVAFTFTGSGAVPATVQVYTTFPQTVDNATALSDIQSRLPAALVSGRMSSDVVAISGDTTAADNAEAFFDGTGYAGTNNVIPTVTTLTNLPAITSGWLTATGIAADAFTAAKFAADVTTELQSGLATASALSTLQTSVNTIDDFIDTEVAAIKAVTDKLDDTLEDDAGTYRFTANALEEAPSGGGGGGATAQEIWEYDISAISTANLAATVLKARASQTSLDDLNDITAADVWAAGTRTLTAGTNIVLAKGTGVTGFNDLSAAQVNAEVDTAISDVGLTTTVTGRIDAAISTRLASASYTAPDNASITLILEDTGTTIPGTISTLQTSVNDVPTNAELTTALSGLATAAALSTTDGKVDAIKAKTDNLPSDPADASVIAGRFDTVDASLTAIAGYVDTEVAAIKAKTDLIPASPAAVSDIPTAAQNATAVLTTAMTESYAADGAAPTLAQAIFMCQQRLTEFAIVGTTITIKRLDGSTAAATLTLDSATAPTSSTRAT